MEAFNMADIVRVDGAGELDGIYEFVNYIKEEPAYAYITNDMCDSEIKVWTGYLILVCKLDDRKDMGSVMEVVE